MLFAELDATGWTVVVGAAVVGIGGIVTSTITAVLSYRREQAKILRDDLIAEKAELRAMEQAERDRVAAKRVESVKIELAATTDKALEAAAVTAGKLAVMEKLNIATHGLVNSAHGVVLATNAELSEWKAKETGDPVDIANAVSARRRSDEHVAAQKKVDSDADKRNGHECERFLTEGSQS